MAWVPDAELLTAAVRREPPSGPTTTSTASHHARRTHLIRTGASPLDLDPEPRVTAGACAPLWAPLIPPSHLDLLTRKYTNHPAYYGHIYPEAQRLRETRVICRIHPRRVTLDAIHIADH